MPKKSSKPAGNQPKRHRQTTRCPPRQPVQKPVSRPMQIARVEILTQLSDTVAACEELFQAHGQACASELCCLVTNCVGSLRLFHLLVEIT